MSAAHGIWHFITLLFALGVVGSIATVVLFSIELVRVAFSKDGTAENYAPEDSSRLLNG